MNLRELPISLTLLLVPVLLGLSACSSPPAALISTPPPVSPSSAYVPDASGLFLKGMQYEDLGVVDSAAFFYHHALMVHDDPWLRFSLARCLDAMSLQEIALDFLRPIASLPDPPVEPALMLAELYMNQDDMDSAAALLRRFPTYPTARAMLADAIVQDQPATARDMYRELLAADPESDNLAVGLVMAHVLLGTCDSAVKEARGLEQRSPGQRNTAVLLSLSLACVGDTSQALAIYEERLADSPPSADHVMEFVTMCMNRKEPIRALQLLERANADPEQEDADAQRYLREMTGLALSTPVLAPRVLATMRAALPEWPRSWEPRYHIARLLSSMGDHRGARASMDSLHLAFPEAGTSMPELVELQLGLTNQCGDHEAVLRVMRDREQRGLPSTPGMLYALGFAANRLGQGELAADAYRRWLAVDPTNAVALGSQADVLNSLGRYAESDSLYERALATLLLSSHSDSFGYYALLCNNHAFSLAERSEHLNRALDLSERAVVHDSLNSAYLDTRAWVLFKAGRATEALPILFRAIALREKETGASASPLYHHLGDIHLALGQSAEARRAWKRALDLDPHNSLLRKKLTPTR